MQAFRQALPEDADAINAFIRRSKGYWGYDEALLDAFISDFGISPSFIGMYDVEIMSVDNLWVGIWAFEIKPDEEPYLDYLFIAPEAIGQGYGRLLFRRLEAYAREHNFESFWFYADPKSEGFYHKMGATTFSHQRSYEKRLVPMMRFVII